MSLLRRMSLAVALVAISASSAMAGFTTNQAGPIASATPVGAGAGTVGTNNSSFVHNYAGPEFTPGTVTVVGTLTSTGVGSWARESVFEICNPNSCFALAQSSLNTGSSTFTVVNVNATVPLSGLTGTSIGNWTFEAFETYNDAGASVDANWSNLSITINDAAPPPPAFGGDFTGTPNVLTPGNKAFGTTIYDHQNPQPGLTDGAGEFAAGTDYPVFSWDLVGNEVAYKINHSGGDLSLLLTGLSSDLDLLLLDATGTPAGTLEGSEGNTGSADETISVAGLAAGTYYAVVDTFGGTNLGSNFSLTYVPEPATLALLAMGAFGLIRRRR